MEENQNASLHSVTVNDLIYGISNKRLCFVVPSYQRGYRWTKSQVNRLLTDLFDFRTEKEKGNKMVGDFYCLQPIVVKKLENVDIRIKLGQCYNIDPKIDYFEIVDGQQRMTTVFILLKYLLDDMQPYDIEFERDKEKQFARKTLLNSLCRSVDLSSFSCDYADAYYAYRDAIHADANHRIGNGIAAYDVVIRAKRLCRLMSLKAPEIIINNEANLLAQAIAIHACCKEMKTVDDVE